MAAAGKIVMNQELVLTTIMKPAPIRLRFATVVCSLGLMFAPAIQIHAQDNGSTETNGTSSISTNTAVTKRGLFRSMVFRPHMQSVLSGSWTISSDHDL